MEDLMNQYKTILVSVLMCLWMFSGMEGKAMAVGRAGQTAEQTVTQAVKDKVWRLEADMVFLSGGKTGALSADSCFMEVNETDATIRLPYLAGEQDSVRTDLKGKITAYLFRDKGDHYTVNLHVSAGRKSYSFTVHVYKEDGLGSILLNSTKLSYSAKLVR